MKKEQTLGLLREVLTAFGALAFAGFSGWPSIVGLIVMVASVIWAFAYNEGAEVAYTGIRKILSAAPGVMVELGWIDMEQASSLAAFLLPAAAMVWSYLSKGSTTPPMAFPVLIQLAALSFLLPSCNVVGSAITGQAIPSTPVQRSGHDEAPVVHISSSDLALAEKAAEEAKSLGKTPPVHGLYNAGQLAEVARQTVIEATK